MVCTGATGTHLLERYIAENHRILFIYSSQSVQIMENLYCASFFFVSDTICIVTVSSVGIIQGNLHIIK